MRKYHHYSAFGLHVAAEFPLAGLAVAPVRAHTDVQVLHASTEWMRRLTKLDQQVCHISPYQDETGEPSFRVWTIKSGGLFRFSYCDGVEFVLTGDGNRVWALWPPSMATPDAVTYLLGPIFGFLLRLRGLMTLHASAVCVGSCAVAFVGPQGAGKSTTAAALAIRGCPVLSDDIVAFREDLLIQPAYPQLNLWPEAGEALYGDRSRLPPITPNWDKRYLDLTEDGYRFQKTPLPLGAVYLLSPRSEHPALVDIQQVSALDGFMRLVENSYGAHRLNKKMRLREFNLVGRVSKAVPFRRLTATSDPSQLGDVCEMILRDCGRILSGNCV